MKKNFKRDLLIKTLLNLLLSLSICTFIFLFLHIKYMLQTNTKHLSQVSMDSEKLIVNALDSLKSSTDLLANTLGSLSNLDSPENQNIITNLVSVNPFIKRAFITKIDGMQIAKYPQIGNISVAKRTYFKQALTGQSTFSPVKLSSLTGDAIIVYCTPIKSKGTIIGTVSSVIEINSLNDSLNLTTKGLHCTFGLLDNHGSLLLTNIKDSLLLSDSHRSSIENDKIKKIINLSDLEPIKKMIQGKSGHGKFNLHNTKALTNYRSFKDYDLNLITAIPYSSINNSIITYMLIGFTILILIMLISSIAIKRFTNNITNPITNLSLTLKHFSQGNLELAVDKNLLRRNDEFSELGKSFVIFSNKINNVIKNFKINAKQLSDYSNSLNETVSDNKKSQLYIGDMISNVNTKMSSNLLSLKENLTILQEFSQGIDNVNLNLESLNSAVNNSTLSAKQGAEHANTTEHTLNESLDSLKYVNDKMNTLNNMSNKITSLVDTITDIATETNLLSLNASIEAARAGESGKGFAIVAEKIKTLAEQSSKSSENIDELLSNIHSEIISTSNIVNDMNNKFKNLVENTKLTTNLMSDIKDKAVNSQLSVEEIIAVIEEQTAGIEDSTGSLTKVVNYINDTLNASESINSKLDDQSKNLDLLSNVSSSLNDISDEIKNDLDYFK